MCLSPDFTIISSNLESIHISTPEVLHLFVNLVFARFIERAENELEKSTIKQIFIEWDFESNITEATEKKKLEYQVRG